MVNRKTSYAIATHFPLPRCRTCIHYSLLVYNCHTCECVSVDWSESTSFQCDKILATSRIYLHVASYTTQTLFQISHRMSYQFNFSRSNKEAVYPYRLIVSYEFCRINYFYRAHGTTLSFLFDTNQDLRPIHSVDWESHRAPLWLMTIWSVNTILCCNIVVQ